MIKEKIIFWPLLAVFIGILIFGSFSQGRKKEANEELLQDIEVATKKIKAKMKVTKDTRDLGLIKTVDALSGYGLLLKRSPFFRIPDETAVKEVEVVSLKEEPKKPELKYKGRIKMGAKVLVVIEEQGTGKSYFVEEGDMVGDFLVSLIDDRQVVFKKKGGEEIILSAVEERDKEKEVEEDKIEMDEQKTEGQEK